MRGVSLLPLSLTNGWHCSGGCAIRAGLKFFVTAQPKTPHLAHFLRVVYAHYTDYVLKVGCCVQGLVAVYGVARS